MIILIASIGMIVTFFIMQNLLGEKAKRETTIPVVDPISSEDKSPSRRIFNENAINPTVEIFVDNDIVSNGNNDKSNQDKNNLEFTEGNSEPKN